MNNPFLHTTSKTNAVYRSINLGIILSVLVTYPALVLAGPSSSNYELKTYEFGAGGVSETSSSNYSLQGVGGGQDAQQTDSTNYQVGGGLTFSNQANVPAAPIFINPATNYDRLQYIIDTGGNPSATIFALAISSDDFLTTGYVQSDGTIGVLASWQTYSAWGGINGGFVRTLRPSTAYKIKVKAKNGSYTESGFSLTASATTSIPSLTFGISQNSLTFNNLNSGNSYTDSTKTTNLTTSTNAYYGYTVYGHETGPLTSGPDTISDYSGSNGSPTAWTGTGFGYTTNDSDLAGGTANRFTNPTAKYAGFTTSAPGDPVADHTAVLSGSVITNEQFTIGYRLTADSTAKAGAYTTNIIYVVVPTY